VKLTDSGADPTGRYFVILITILFDLDLFSGHFSGETLAAKSATYNAIPKEGQLLQQ